MFLHQRAFLSALGLSVLFYATSQAQSKSSAPVKGASQAAQSANSMRNDLQIAPLPQVPIEFEFIGTQQDLQGLVKSLAISAKAKAAAPKAAQPKAKPQAAKTDATAAQLDATTAEKIKLELALSQDELLQMIDDIRFVRVESFNFLQGEGKEVARRAREADPQRLSGAMSVDAYQKLLIAPLPRLDVQEFYGKTFRAQNGRRQLFFSSGATDNSHSSGTTLSLWLFEKPRSWALVTQGPSRAIVVRADSFPPLEAVGRVFKELVSR